MLNAMNTGHEGSLSTVHANTPRDALARVENMVLMAGLELPDRAIREQMSSALDLIIQLARFTDGVRRVTHVTEVTRHGRPDRDPAGPVPLRADRRHSRKARSKAPWRRPASGRPSPSSSSSRGIKLPDGLFLTGREVSHGPDGYVASQSRSSSPSSLWFWRPSAAGSDATTRWRRGSKPSAVADASGSRAEQPQKGEPQGGSAPTVGSPSSAPSSRSSRARRPWPSTWSAPAFPCA